MDTPTPIRAQVAAPACLAGPPPGPPPGPLTTAELAAAVPDPRERGRYRRIWHGLYRRADQPDDLRLRSVALARTFPEGVLRGRSAALLWGDDSAPPDALPEIWLPATRRSREGRVYRYGAMPAAAVAERDGLRVTTPLRTCRDLSRDLYLEDAVVAVERLCAAVPGLAGQLAGAVAHPSGRGARRFGAVVGAVDPASGSALMTRARLTLGAAGFRGFAPGHEIGSGRRTVLLPLADPVARFVVVAPAEPRRPGDRGPTEQDRALLRRSGWTVFLLRGRTRPPDDATAHPAGHGMGGGHEVLAVLRARWPGTVVLGPSAGDSAADPHGIWARRRR